MKKISMFNNKKGSVLIFGYLIVFVAVIFMAIVIDIGFAYVNKSQVQHITDAATIGGASWGKYAYFSVADGSPQAVIIQDDADRKAREIVRENDNYLSSNLRMNSPRFNVEGDYGLSSRDQYADGSFTTVLASRMTPFFGGVEKMRFWNISTRSRVQVYPSVVSSPTNP